MKLFLKHITSYLMIAVVLVATLQWSVTKMTCLMTGKVVYSIEDIDDCKPVKEGCNVDDVCCDFHKITFNHNIETVSSVANFSFINLDLITVEIPQLIELIKFKETTLNFFHNLPPPLSGIALLKTIQVFRL
ncbi:MAG: hypothetical protein H6587_12305 [Flavobacteriales bacterium]|nr:hypothetical protein [Flavobacteriales bacterium]MCB9365344.1 hypothetical protein [Flavobacteriales bacterium]